MLGASRNQLLLAAVAADKLAGGPLHQYLERTKNREALTRLHFWEDTQRFIVPTENLGIITKCCMANAIIGTYIESGAPRNLALSTGLRRELADVLPGGQGDALLLYVAQNVAQVSAKKAARRRRRKVRVSIKPRRHKSEILKNVRNTIPLGQKSSGKIVNL